MKIINIYTDGSSKGNPGPGGFGVILQFGAQVKELSQGFSKNYKQQDGTISCNLRP